MKTILIHGDHVARSYARLSELVDEAKKQNLETIKIDAQKESNLPEKLRSKSLFEKARLIVLEKLDKIQKKELAKVSSVSEKEEGTLVIYLDREIPKTVAVALPQNTKTEVFKLPKTIFAFLDSFFPGNARNCLILLRALNKTEAPEFILALLGKYVRDLYWVRIGNNLPYPAWRTGKLKSQSQKFTLEKLKEIITTLSDIDIKSKIGEIDLASSLDLLIATRLE